MDNNDGRNALLCLKDINKSYGPLCALKDLNLEIESGSIVGLLGPNGSGKTTMMKLIAGLLKPDKGTITAGGMNIGSETKSIVSYLPEKSYLDDKRKISYYLDLFKSFYTDFDYQRAKEMLRSLGIDTEKRIGELSKGGREKVQLALVMSRNARIYLLDEPIAGVDPAVRDYIISSILSKYDENASIIISTHLVSDIESVMDKVLFLRDGSVIEYSDADSLRKREGKSVDKYFREVFAC